MKPDALLDMPIVEGHFEDTAYNVSGNQAGATVVLIHGVGMNRSVWQPQLVALGSDYRVISYDILGHGGSGLPSASPTLEDYAAQLACLLAHLQARAVHVVGHSMGALIALEYALRHLDSVASVTALNAVYDRSPAQSEAVMRRAASLDVPSVEQPGIDATIARWFDTPIPAHLLDAAASIRKLLSSVDARGYARTYQLFARADRAHVGRLEKLTIPALFMTGELDPNSSPSMSRAMAAQAPFGTALIVPNERHMMNVTAPEEVNRRLANFIESVSRSA